MGGGAGPQDPEWGLKVSLCRQDLGDGPGLRWSVLLSRRMDRSEVSKGIDFQTRYHPGDPKGRGAQR